MFCIRGKQNDAHRTISYGSQQKSGREDLGRRTPQVRRLLRASIEPRLYERGNPSRDDNLHTDCDASIGPRSIKRGNNGVVIFDEAHNAKLQWSHVLPSMDIVDALARDANAVTSERGNSRQSCRLQRPHRSFNGATLIRAWKPRVNQAGNQPHPNLQWSHIRANMEL